MSRHALTALWLVAGILAIPMAPLICNGADRTEAAACCRQRANDCNRPGMADDCCRTTPGSDEGAPTVAKAQEPTKLHRSLVSGPALLVTVDSIALGSPGRCAHATARDVVVDASPPPFSVLRV